MTVDMKGADISPTLRRVRIILVDVIGISWRKIHVKQAPAMAVVTILDNSLKRSDGVNYRRVKTCRLCLHIAEQSTVQFISCFRRI